MCERTENGMVQGKLLMRWRVKKKNKKQALITGSFSETALIIDTWWTNEEERKDKTRKEKRHEKKKERKNREREKRE